MRRAGCHRWRNAVRIALHVSPLLYINIADVLASQGCRRCCYYHPENLWQVLMVSVVSVEFG